MVFVLIKLTPTNYAPADYRSIASIPNELAASILIFNKTMATEVSLQSS
jgi:hypothetical protein